MALSPPRTSPSVLGWGQPEGARVDIVARSGDVDVPEPVEIAPATWMPLPSAGPWALPANAGKRRGVVAQLDGSRALRFVWPREADPMASFRDVVEAAQGQGNPVPWPLVAAIHVALQSRQARVPPSRWQEVVQPLVATFGGLSTELAPIPKSREIEALARSWDGFPETLPRNSYARMRFMREVGRLAWDLPPVVPLVNTVSLLAGLHLYLQPRPWEAEIPGAGAIRPAEDTLANAISLYYVRIALSRHPVSTRALGFLLRGRMMHPPGDADIEEPPEVALGQRQVPSVEDPVLLRGMARQLLQEASEFSVYAPVGPMRIPVPGDTLLEAWGIREMRVWAEPGGLWTSLVVAEDRVAAVFWWEPRQEALQDSLMVPGWAETALETTLAALWRDLRVAGPVVFPRRGEGRGTWRVEGAAASEPSRRASRARPQRRDLPRTRRPQSQQWRLKGDPREWGRQDEREEIRRRARFVAGHHRVILYAAETRVCPLLAATEDPPLEQWRGRLKQSRERFALFGLPRDDDEAAWWETLLSAAGSTHQGADEDDRLRIVHAVLAGAWRRNPGRPDLRVWIERAQKAIEEAIERGVEEALERPLRELDQLRAKAAERARAWGMAPPIPGYTIVRPTVPSAESAPDSDAPVVRAKGLLTLHAFLGVRK